MADDHDYHWIDRYEPFWVDSDHLTLIRRMGEKDMAGIINNKIEKKEVTNDKKDTHVYHNCPDLYHSLQIDYTNINRYPVGSYKDALEDAKKRLNSMYGFYGIGHSISATVLRSDFARFLNEVKDIKFSGPATIVFWKDGTKTVVKCQEGEHYDPKDGIEYALFKKIAGGTSNQASKMAKKYDEWLEKWIPEDLKEETIQEEPTSDYEFMKEASDYLAEEMKKRLVGLGELADTVKAATDRVRAATEEVRKAKDLYFREHSNDKPEETEEK